MSSYNSNNPKHRNQLYATVSVSGDAVVIEENEEGMVDENDEADPRLAAVRWRRRAQAAVVVGYQQQGGDGGLVGVLGEQSVLCGQSSPRGGEEQYRTLEEAGAGSPLAQQLLVGRGHTE